MMYYLYHSIFKNISGKPPSKNYKDFGVNEGKVLDAKQTADVSTNNTKYLVANVHYHLPRAISSVK